MRILLHICCGVCAAGVAEKLTGEGHDVVGFFFNPNIHPRDELERREAVMDEACEALDLPAIPAGPAMSTAEFLLHLARFGGRRCRACYELRLRMAAEEAARQGCDAISTTLLISPYQQLDAIAEIGRAVAEKAGVEFVFRDLRGEYPQSCERARELGLYRQNYCGCLFSALERAERRARRAMGKTLSRSRA